MAARQDVERLRAAQLRYLETRRKLLRDQPNAPDTAAQRSNIQTSWEFWAHASVADILQRYLPYEED